MAFRRSPRLYPADERDRFSDCGPSAPGNSSFTRRRPARTPARGGKRTTSRRSSRRGRSRPASIAGGPERVPPGLPQPAGTEEAPAQSSIDLDAWDRLADKSYEASPHVGTMTLVTDTDPERSRTSIAAAGARADGLPMVEIIDNLLGVGRRPHRDHRGPARHPHHRDRQAIRCGDLDRAARAGQDQRHRHRDREVCGNSTSPNSAMRSAARPPARRVTRGRETANVRPSTYPRSWPPPTLPV
jgi:hypothetical protein